MLGVIPLGLITLYANVFVGPATLSEIPEDYTPKYWEYYRVLTFHYMARVILNETF
jgi:NADH dehydrogenase (ubiquinone) 1 beta subcomplex subunit 5